MGETRREGILHVTVRTSKRMHSSGLSRRDILLGISMPPPAAIIASNNVVDTHLVEFDEEEVWAAEGLSIINTTTSNINSSSVRKARRPTPIQLPATNDWSGGGGGNIGSANLSQSESPHTTSNQWSMNGLIWSLKEASPKSPLGGGQRVSREGTPRRFPTASRMIPRSLLPEEGPKKRVIPQSAPVKIPDWSCILRVEKEEKMLGPMNDSEYDEEQLPPHELIAREEYARDQFGCFSVLEGAGRTLKGRDLRRVRDAVLTQTGFLE